MLILPPERSLTRSANLVAASPHGPVGPTTRLDLYSGLYVAAPPVSGRAQAIAKETRVQKMTTCLRIPPPLIPNTQFPDDVPAQALQDSWLRESAGPQRSHRAR